MILWEKEDGTEVATNEEDANIEAASALGWVAKARVTETGDVIAEFDTDDENLDDDGDKTSDEDDDTDDENLDDDEE